MLNRFLSDDNVKMVESLREDLKKVVSTLTQREQRIIDLRFILQMI